MKLKDYRQAAGKTQKEVAALLHISTKTYQNYEYEVSQPNISTLCQLANFYRISMDELIGRKSEATTKLVSGEECQLVAYYRNMLLKAKSALLMVAESLAKSSC